MTAKRTYSAGEHNMSSRMVSPTATTRKTHLMIVLIMVGFLLAFQYQFNDHQITIDRMTMERETLQYKLNEVAQQMKTKDDELVKMVEEHKTLLEKKMVTETSNLFSQLTALQEAQNKKDKPYSTYDVKEPYPQPAKSTTSTAVADTSNYPAFPNTKFTPHVNEVLQVIDDVTLHLPIDAANPWPYDPHKYCGYGYHIFVDKPYTAPTAIECNPSNNWCAYFQRLFNDPTRVLPYNVSVGESTADMIKKGSMAWGQCIASSGPEGGFSMNNFQDAKALMQEQDPQVTGYVHVHKRPWEERHQIPVFRGHPRMIDRGPWKRNVKFCPKNTVESGEYGHRPRSVLFSLDHPDLLDARVSYVKHSCESQNATNQMDRVFGWGKYHRDEDIKIPSEDYYTDYQVAVVLGGIGAAFRTPTHMSAGQAIVLQRFTYEEWYVPYMTPYVHYIPLQNDLSDMKEVLEWVRDNPVKVKEIAENGKQFYQDWLSFPQTNEHWHELLWRLSELIYNEGPERLKTGTIRTIWPGPIVPYRFVRDPKTGKFVEEERQKTRKPYLDYDVPLGEPTQK